uniref:Uncharacterized protein n=1 Tax=Bacteriophage sp. TaxID=38018 RepID=A0A7G8LRK8_9VIRU|nr:MAG: hypothetical protein [Bacteriophage sp.]
MTSTYNDIRAAIEGRIAAELAKAPVYPVSYQNIPFTPPNSSPWLQVFLRLGDNAYATLNGPSTGFNKQNGVLVVNVFTPAVAGAALNFTIAERIKDLFDRQTVSGIIFDAASGPNVMVPSAPEPAYYQTQLTITFEAYVD